MKKEKVCSRCGKCCQGFHITIPDLNKDLKKYFEYHSCKIEKINGMQTLYIGSKCYYLNYNWYNETYSCMIYENRPTVCKEAYEKNRKDVIFPKGCTMK